MIYQVKYMKQEIQIFIDWFRSGSINVTNLITSDTYDYQSHEVRPATHLHPSLSTCLS
jgi:hypothetical protein